MRNIKKVLSVFVVISLILSVATISFSATTYFSDGIFTFSKNGDDTITIESYDITDSDMVVPDSIFEDTVVAIADLAFYDNDYIITATFPETLTSIGSSAFNYASNLTTVTIPAACTSVAKGAFQNCPSLTTITINSPLTVINDQTFYKCTSLEAFVIPSTVESIGKFAFSDCTSLKSVTIPRTTTSIATNAFRNCSDVTIYCYENSYVHTYAVDNNIPYVLLEEVVYELGDVDLGGGIDIKDATLIQKYLAEIITFNDAQLSVADYNQDGQINVMDATTIQKYLVS